MSNRHVSFDIESRDSDGRPVMVINLFEIMNQSRREIDETVYLYPHQMHLAPQFPGRHVHEIDFAPIERRVMAYMDELIAQDFIPRPIDFDICDVVAQMKTELKAQPHEPHRTYDWRQRLASRRRKR